MHFSQCLTPTHCTNVEQVFPTPTVLTHVHAALMSYQIALVLCRALVPL